MVGFRTPVATAVYTMTTSELIALLDNAGVPAVIIGGIAMRLHGSPRATQDLDLSVAAASIDVTIRALYQARYVLVSAVSDENATVFGTLEAALTWVDSANPGSLTLIKRPRSVPEVASCDVSHQDIEVESQVDLLYDLTVPFGRLLHDATETEIDGVRIRYASARHLLLLKQARRNPSPADDADIAYLQTRLADA